MQEQTTIEKPELRIPATLKALVEALIFAAQEPLSLNQIRAVYQGEGVWKDESRSMDPETLRRLVSDLNKEYEKDNRPFRIVQIAGGYQFATLSVYAEWLGKLYKEQGRRKLSQSGVETLAIVAYKQPITKAEVEKIRGVNCDYVLKTLLEKELLAITGRAESVGRPLLYGTTKEFLKHFGLNDITDLPRPREIEEILGESQFETERRMLEAQAGAEQMKKEQDDFKSRLPHIPQKKSGLDEEEVEIVPQTKTREIRLVPTEDRKLLEETGQEDIELSDAAKKKEPEDHPGGFITEEQAIMMAPDTHLQEKITDESLQMISVESKHQIIHDLTEKNLEPSSAEGKEINKGAPLSSGLEKTRIPGTDTAETEPQLKPKRWQVWKEKIQSFIKRLFV